MSTLCVVNTGHSSAAQTEIPLLCLYYNKVMVGPDGLEPSTPRLSSACSNQLSYEPKIGESGDDLPGRVPNFGGAGEIRTRDPLLAKQMLYQLSYDPEIGRLC